MGLRTPGEDEYRNAAHHWQEKWNVANELNQQLLTGLNEIESLLQRPNSPDIIEAGNRVRDLLSRANSIQGSGSATPRSVKNDTGGEAGNLPPISGMSRIASDTNREAGPIQENPNQT